MRRGLVAIALGAAALLAAGPSFAGLKPGEPDLAYGAYQRGYFRTAFQEAMKRVEADPHDAAAMTLVAELFADGVGAPLNPDEAMKWYKLAAEQGDKNAQYALANAYLTGKGEPKDVATARAWFEK
uniref:tetratricopeptide repeat protein n=1 Tax=Rhodoblastus sp. TaxID=1962975 RepID=UPI003F9DA61E